MQLPVVLNVCDKKTLFGKKFSVEDAGDICLVKIQEKRKSLKKVADVYKNSKILVNNQIINKNIFRGKLKNCFHIDFNIISKLIERICKAVVYKNYMELPLNELVIVARNEVAYTLVVQLLSIAKMFTIISDSEDRKIFDEMYFKYGCVIRQKRSLEELSGDNSIILCAEENYICREDDIVVLNMTQTYDNRKNTINIYDISINDSRLYDLIAYWGGCPGIEIYNVLNILPDNDVTIEINKKTDRIFLLDIEEI